MILYKCKLVKAYTRQGTQPNTRKRGGGSMQDLINFLTIVNILKISLDFIKNLIDILKYCEDKKKNAKGRNPKRKK